MCCGRKMIFMDINMPIMNGFETSEKIIALSNENAIHKPIIIACTAYDD